MLNNIKESYCSFEVHSLLVEKGCIIPITENSVWIPQSMAIEWIRINFGFYIDSYVDDDQTFGYLVTRFSDMGRHDYPLVRNFKERQDAVNAALIYVLTKLI